MSIYVGDNTGKPRLAHKLYVGVGGVAKKISKIYVGHGIVGDDSDAGTARLCWDSKIPEPEYVTIDSNACLRLINVSKRATHCRVVLAYPFDIPTQTFEIPITPTEDVSINLINIQEYDNIISDVTGQVSVTLYDSTEYFTPCTYEPSVVPLVLTIRERSGGLRFDRSLYRPSKTLTMDQTGMFEYRDSTSSTVVCSTFVVNDVGVWYGSKQAYDFASGEWLLPHEINIIMPWYISDELDNWLAENEM